MYLWFEFILMISSYVKVSFIKIYVDHLKYKLSKPLYMYECVCMRHVGCDRGAGISWISRV